MASETKQHDYHLVDPSPWPFLGAFGAFSLALGGVAYMHDYSFGGMRAILGLMIVVGTMYVWWRDVIKEGRHDKAHTAVVRHGLRLGMLLFILSEVMFFFAFFWSFFKAWLAPVMLLDEGVTHLFENAAIVQGVWPPAHIETIGAWGLPFLNTLILLLSGTTVTWAHHALLHNDRRGLRQGLLITVLLGLSFTAIQAFEYGHAAFGFKEGIYPSNFYMATGFHGFHVLVGTIFLIVCYVRARAGGFSKEHHLGFEFAAWYWHFVDVVWLFLFTFVYWLSAI